MRKFKKILFFSAIFFILSAFFSAPLIAQTDLKQIYSSDLVYQGAFKLPQGTLGSTWGYGSYAGCCGLGAYAVTYNPAHNSIFIGGHPYEQKLAEIAVPSSLSGTPNATALTDLVDPFEGKLNSINPSDPNTKILYMSLVYNNKLYLAGHSYYDGGQTQIKSHFSRPLDLTVKSQVTGPAAISGGRHPGWYDKYAALIPRAWQQSLGGPALTGGSGGAINGSQSWGPSVSVFNPADIGAKDPVPANLVLGYPILNRLGSDSANDYWSQCDVITGVVFPEGTKTVLFIGKHGAGGYCYGEGSTCKDPADSSKGTHCYPYKSWVWAYDANDLAAVKSGQKQAHSLIPYAVWNLDSSFTEIQGAAYDPVTQRIFLSQVGGDGDRPLIRVYKVNAAGSTVTPPPAVKKGDLNSDSKVDIIDLGIFLSNWGVTPPAGGSDINQDGRVDIVDLGILLSNWG